MSIFKFKNLKIAIDDLTLTVTEFSSPEFFEWLKCSEKSEPIIERWKMMMNHLVKVERGSEELSIDMAKNAEVPISVMHQVVEEFAKAIMGKLAKVALVEGETNQKNAE